MSNYKRFLFGHVEEQINNVLLQKQRQRDLPVQTSNRPTGSYVLVNVPSKKISHQTPDSVRSDNNSTNQTGNI